MTDSPKHSNLRLQALFWGSADEPHTVHPKDSSPPALVGPVSAFQPTPERQTHSHPDHHRNRLHNALLASRGEGEGHAALSVDTSSAGPVAPVILNSSPRNSGEAHSHHHHTNVSSSTPKRSMFVSLRDRSSPAPHSGAPSSHPTTTTILGAAGPSPSGSNSVSPIAATWGSLNSIVLSQASPAGALSPPTSTSVPRHGHSHKTHSQLEPLNTTTHFSPSSSSAHSPPSGQPTSSIPRGQTLNPNSSSNESLDQMSGVTRPAHPLLNRMPQLQEIPISLHSSPHGSPTVLRPIDPAPLNNNNTANSPNGPVGGERGRTRRVSATNATTLSDNQPNSGRTHRPNSSQSSSRDLTHGTPRGHSAGPGPSHSSRSNIPLSTSNSSLSHQHHPPSAGPQPRPQTSTEPTRVTGPSPTLGVPSLTVPLSLSARSEGVSAHSGHSHRSNLSATSSLASDPSPQRNASHQRSHRNSLSGGGASGSALVLTSSTSSSTTGSSGLLSGPSPVLPASASSSSASSHSFSPSNSNSASTASIPAGSDRPSSPSHARQPTRAAQASPPAPSSPTSTTRNFSHASIESVIIPDGPPVIGIPIITEGQVGRNGGGGISTSRSAGEDLCLLCCTKPKNAVLIPCGHVAFCADCAYTLEVMHKVCPICRAPNPTAYEIFKV